MMFSSGLGRTARGRRLAFCLDATEQILTAPVVDFWYNGSSNEASSHMYDKGGYIFAISQFLDSRFIDGQWVAAVRYTVSGVQQYRYFHFEVVGGEPCGAVVAIHQLRRPLGQAVVTITEDGRARIGYNPRIS